MEYLDICNENGEPTGEIVDRNIAHRDGILHRTAHVLIIRNENGKNQVLLQKRSMDKESFPGQYDTSSAGHIPAGTEPLPSALRELEEELGIKAEPQQLKLIAQFRNQYEKIFYGKPFRDNEFISVYVYEDPVDIQSLKLQESEVDEVQWFDLDEVYDEIQTSRERFCIPMQDVEILLKYLNN